MRILQVFLKGSSSSLLGFRPRCSMNPVSNYLHLDFHDRYRLLQVLPAVEHLRTFASSQLSTGAMKQVHCLKVDSLIIVIKTEHHTSPLSLALEGWLAPWSSRNMSQNSSTKLQNEKSCSSKPNIRTKLTNMTKFWTVSSM